MKIIILSLTNNRAAYEVMHKRMNEKATTILPTDMASSDYRMSIIRNPSEVMTTELNYMSSRN